MTLQGDLAQMQSSADRALMGGENIAGFAKTMFSGLTSMEQDLIGRGGAAFQRVQETMRQNLEIIDRTLNQVGNGIKDSSLNFGTQDDDNAATIDSSLGGDAVSLLTQGQ
jgi:uncharacterized protein YukE